MRSTPFELAAHSQNRLDIRTTNFVPSKRCRSCRLRAASLGPGQTHSQDACLLASFFLMRQSWESGLCSFHPGPNALKCAANLNLIYLPTYLPTHPPTCAVVVPKPF